MSDLEALIFPGPDKGLCFELGLGVRFAELLFSFSPMAEVIVTIFIGAAVRWRIALALKGQYIRPICWMQTMPPSYYTRM